MIDRLHITDHAVLTWMQHAYGVDVPLWRQMMRDEADASLREYRVEASGSGDAFAISAEGKVLGFVQEGYRAAFPIGMTRSAATRPIFVPRIVAPACLSVERF